MEKEFEITVSAPERRFDGAEDSPARPGGPFDELAEDTGVDGGVADDASAGDIGGARFELGLEEDNAGRGRCDSPGDRGEDFAE